MENCFFYLKRIRNICFFVFCFLLFLFLSFFVYIDADALSAGQQPYSIKSNSGNSSEFYNIYNNGTFFEPRDTGNVLAYFNYAPCQLNFSSNVTCPVANYHGVDNVDFEYDSLSSNTITLYYSTYYYGYMYIPFPWRFVLQTDSGFVQSNLEMQFITNAKNVDYACNGGNICSVTPTFNQGVYIGNGGWRYIYSVTLTNPDNNGHFWIKTQPWNTDSPSMQGFTTGVSIDNIVQGATSQSYAELISNDNSNTNSIITNIGGLPGKIASAIFGFLNDPLGSIINGITSLPNLIWNYFSGGFTSIIGGISNLPGSIFNLFGGVLSNIEGGISGLLTGISNIPSAIWGFFSGGFNTITNFLSNIFNGIGNIISGIGNILSDDTPTSEWLTNYINNFPGINDNIIAQIITLPIHILTKLIGVNTCAPVILGNMYGTTLILPCLSNILSNILGSLINIVGWMVAFYIYYIMAVKIKDLLFEMLTLESNVARKMKIKF